MRRKELEVTNPNQIEQIIQHCNCIRIGMYADDEMYIVPLSFGYEKKDDTYIFYFHSAKQGRKIEMLKQNPNVAFEMDCGYELSFVEDLNECSNAYKSIIGTGKITFLEDFDTKVHALTKLMEHYHPHREMHFNESLVQRTCVLQLEVTSLSAKQHP